jgi:hypothetical protein
VSHLLRHGTSVLKVISERPVILTSECRALDEGAITIPILNILGLTRPARVPPPVNCIKEAQAMVS